MVVAFELFFPSNIQSVSQHLTQKFRSSPNIKDNLNRMWIKKFLNVNINNFENVDKPKGGGVGQCG